MLAQISRTSITDSFKMVTVINMCNVFVTVTAFIITFFTLDINAKVHEVNKANFNKWIQGKFFTLTFVDSPSCTRCRLLFPFFAQAGQVFHNDPEIFLARTHDKALIKEWDVKELPALIYHLHGKPKHNSLTVDITVDDIVDIIARLLHGNFASMKRRYTTELTLENFQEMVITPRQAVLLLIYDQKSEAEKKALEKVAYAFRKDDAILFAVLNAQKQKVLRDEKFKTREVPALMWFQADEKHRPKRFGSWLSPEVITMFVNERTGLNRDTEGGILDDAGRVPAADELIKEYAEDIISAKPVLLTQLSQKISAIKSKVEKHQEEMLDFYIFVLDNIGQTGHVGMLKELINGEEEKLSEKDELATKERETYKRRRNILKFMQKVVNDFKKNKKSQKQFPRDEEEILVLDPKNPGGGSGRVPRHTEL